MPPPAPAPGRPAQRQPERRQPPLELRRPAPGTRPSGGRTTAAAPAAPAADCRRPARPPARHPPGSRPHRAADPRRRRWSRCRPRPRSRDVRRPRWPRESARRRRGSWHRSGSGGTSTTRHIPQASATSSAASLAGQVGPARVHRTAEASWTAAVRHSPRRAASSAAAVPSPPSASGTSTRSSPGRQAAPAVRQRRRGLRPPRRCPSACPARSPPAPGRHYPVTSTRVLVAFHDATTRTPGRGRAARPTRGDLGGDPRHGDHAHGSPAARRARPTPLTWFCAESSAASQGERDLPRRDQHGDGAVASPAMRTEPPR